MEHNINLSRVPTLHNLLNSEETAATTTIAMALANIKDNIPPSSLAALPRQSSNLNGPPSSLKFDSQTTDEEFELYINRKDIDLNEVRCLDLTGCKNLTGRSSELIKKFTQLKKLNVSGCTGIPVSLLELIENFTQLEELNLSGWTQLRDCNFESFSPPYSLKTLNLNGCSGFSHRGFKTLAAKLDNLKTLIVTNCRQFNLQFLSFLPLAFQLEHVYLSRNSTNTIGMQHVKNKEPLKLQVHFVE